MKTKLFLQALILAILTLIIGRIEAQTVIWERKALGQQQSYPCAGGTFNWPNNNAWTQDQRFDLDTVCDPDQQYEAEPSNWSTPTFPNGAGVDVILGNTGGAPTNLDRGAPITVHSVTILSVGGLTAEFGSSLTAALIDFQGDGSLLAAGGGGANPLFTLTAGGTLKKSAGSGTFALDPSVVLQVPNGGIVASQAGTLQLPSASSYAGGVNCNAASGAVIDLAPAVAVDANAVRVTGLFTGSNNGGAVRLKDGYLTTVPGSGGATFNFLGNTFQWQSGAIGSSAADPFINSGTMNITGSPGLNGQGFVNQGTLAQSGSGALNVAFGRGLTNAASGTFNFQNDNGLTAIGGGGGNPFFNNAGTVRKSAGVGTSLIDRNIVFNNVQGTIRVDTGTLVFANGMTTPGGSGNGGNFVVAPGAILQLTDGANFAVYHGTYSGSGGGTVLLSGGNLAPDVLNTGITFNLPGTMLQWTGGAIGGYQSAVPVTNAGTMTLAGSAEKQTYGNFFNSGTIIQKDTGRLGVSVPNSGGVFTNNTPGIYDLQSDAGLYSGTFNNSGLFKKSGGTGTSLVDGPFNNSGTVAVSSGTLQFTQFHQTAGLTSLNGGNLIFTNEALFDGGSLIGSGTITGSVRNNGATISPGFSPGKIAMSGNYTQGTNGVLTLEIGGTTPVTQYDQLQVNGTATLGGTLNLTLINGYHPAGGETFQFILAGSLTGTFSTVNTIGFTGTINYSSSGITVTVVTPTPTPSPTSTATATIAPSATPTATPSATATIAPSATPTGTPSATATIAPSVTPTGTPSATATIAPSITPTATPSATATIAPSATPTANPSISPTATPIGTPTPSPTPATQAINLSTRMQVQTGHNVGIGGFIITGSVPKNVIIRAVGPSLIHFGVNNVLADPVLELHGPGAFATMTNNNWRDDHEAEIAATSIPPTDDLEAAIVATLNPGAYTAIVKGNGNSSGIALVEVYDLNRAVESRLANLSTRALVGTDENVVIAGFLLCDGQEGKVVVRGVGPSLAPGILPANLVLANPTLELRDGDGTLLIASDDWQDNAAQAAEITDAGLAPTSALEPAVAVTLPPGLYTAILSGLSDGTGVGLVEVYDLGGASLTP
jgi:hypothetical protein